MVCYQHSSTIRLFSWLFILLPHQQLGSEEREKENDKKNLYATSIHSRNHSTYAFLFIAFKSFFFSLPRCVSFYFVVIIQMEELSLSIVKSWQLQQQQQQRVYEFEFARLAWPYLPTKSQKNNFCLVSDLILRPYVDRFSSSPRVAVVSIDSWSFLLWRIIAW